MAAASSRNAGFAAGLAPPGAAPSTMDESQWLELLANGLSFDLSGLAPGPAAATPARVQAFGFAEEGPPDNLEAVTLVPAPHIAGGARMPPVLRSMAGLAAELAKLPGCVAVMWHPARCLSSPAHFGAHIGRWLEGGVFPGLGLASLLTAPDGGLQTLGLALFTGVELRLEPDLVKDRAAAARLALRLMDDLVRHGVPDGGAGLIAPDGRALRLELSPNGRFLRVWPG